MELLWSTNAKPWRSIMVHVMVDKLCFLFDLETTALINLTQYISQVELPQPCDHGNFKKAPGRDNFTWGELSFHVLHAHSSETNFASIGIVSLWIHPRHRSPSVMHTTLYWYYIINCDVWKEIAASFAKVSSDAQLRSAQFFPKVWLFLQPTEHGYWSWDLRKPRGLGPLGSFF